MPGSHIRDALRLIPYGVHVVTLRADDQVNGFTCSWLTRCSGDPPMVALAVKNTHRACHMIPEAGGFVVNILRADQKHLAGYFFGPPEKFLSKFENVETTDGEYGLVLAEALAWLDCRLVGSADPGDHVLFFGQVVHAGVSGTAEVLTTGNTGWHYDG